MADSSQPARRRRWNPISIPEAMPPAVTMRPASTTLARLIRQAGAIFADDLSPQKARILLMLALQTTRDPAAIQKLFDR